MTSVTGWSTLLSARDSNYGSRIDYILATEGLRPWLKFGDIQADVRGSDHCPVYIDLHDEIRLPDGTSLTLREAMHTAERLPEGGLHLLDFDPPPICSQSWPEFAGTQTLVSHFFSKANATAPPDGRPKQTSVVKRRSPASNLPAGPLVYAPIASLASTEGTPIATEPSPSDLANTQRRRKEDLLNARPEGPPEKPRKKQKQVGQTQLHSFFSKSVRSEEAQAITPPISQGKPANDFNSTIIDVDEGDMHSIGHGLGEGDLDEYELTASQMEADYRLAKALEEEEASYLVSDGDRRDSNAWKGLLAPLKPPLCIVHKEPGKRFTVNKPGPNKGKVFFICSRLENRLRRIYRLSRVTACRPVGAGYDRGRSVTLREEVNREYRCDFFKWASDVRKEAPSE